MPGSSFGKLFSITTFGESHGPQIGVIIDGCPANIPLTPADIQKDLDRRRPGQAHTTPRNEADQVHIVSGVFEGLTTGTPLTLVIHNTDHRSKDYSDIKDLFRPGHADYTYQQKYGHRDYRGGGRSSARETATRVAAGAVAKAVLKQAGDIKFYSGIQQIGPVIAGQEQWEQVENNDFKFLDSNKLQELEELFAELKSIGDSVGAVVALNITGLPAGLGEPVFDKLDAELSKAMVSINAVKAVSIGEGFETTSLRGSEYRDQMDSQGFISNKAGGILGGISTGMPICIQTYFKPTSSVKVPGTTQTTDGDAAQVVVKGRHDPCVALRALPIVEAMAALTLADHWLRHKAQNLQVKSN